MQLLVGLYDLRNSSGSIAIFAEIRRASSLLGQSGPGRSFSSAGIPPVI
jgi:hypothetical protein